MSSKLSPLNVLSDKTRAFALSAAVECMHVLHLESMLP